MDKKRHNHTPATAVAARRARIVNYRKLIEALKTKSMTISQMGELIGTETSTTSRYHKAMLLAGITQCVAGRFGPRLNCHAYGLVGDDDMIEKFIAFVAACEAVEDEIGQPRRRKAGGCIGPFDKRTIVKVKATQCGMLRDDLVAALFGAAGVVV